MEAFWTSRHICHDGIFEAQVVRILARGLAKEKSRENMELRERDARLLGLRSSKSCEDGIEEFPLVLMCSIILLPGSRTFRSSLGK